MKRKLTPRKVTHKRIGEHQYVLYFRGAAIGTVDRVKDKAVITYTFRPAHDSTLGNGDKLEDTQMQQLKAKVLALIPEDPPPAPGMPVTEDVPEPSPEPQVESDEIVLD